MMNLIGQVIPLLVAIFAIRILIKELNVDRFGILTLAWAVIGYFSLFDFGLGRALTQVVAEKLGLNETEELPSLIVTSLGLMICLGLLGAVISILLSPILVHSILTIPVKLQAEALRSFYLLGASMPIVVLTAGVRGVLEAQQKFAIVNIIRVIMGLATFLTPLAVLPFSHNLVPIILFLIVGRIGALIWHLIVCFRSDTYLSINPFKKEYFNLKQIRPLLKFGGWMTVSNIIGPFMVYLDRFLIGSFISVAAVSYYVTPYEMVTKMWLVPTAINNVLFPAFATHFAHDKQRVSVLFSQGTKYVYLATFPISLLITTMAFGGLELWLGKDYAEHSTIVAQWITIGVFMNCLAQVAFAFIQGVGRPDITAKLHLLEFPLYFALLFIGLRYAGIEGAARAWVIRVSIDAGLLFYLVYRWLPEYRKYYVKSCILIVISISILIGSMYISGLQVKLLYLVVSLSGLSLLTWFRLITLQEKAKLRSLFNFNIV
jgi:O-antigen/teichoic acid export membrane protein